MGSDSIACKECTCGEQVPANCVRCRECGAFLDAEVQQFHEKKAASQEAVVWNVAYRGQQFGPFPTEVLKQAFATNFVPTEALVWRPGLADWIEAHRVAELGLTGQ